MRADGCEYSEVTLKLGEHDKATDLCLLPLPAALAPPTEQNTVHATLSVTVRVKQAALLLGAASMYTSQPLITTSQILWPRFAWPTGHVPVCHNEPS